MNVSLALKHAQESGIEHVFLDAVSIDQQQGRDDLLSDVVALAKLYVSIPVIAAYDDVETNADRWSSTLHRPWILSELRAYCQNPTRVVHVGFDHGSNYPRALSFTNEVSVIRSEGYAATILEVLYGRVGMTDVADFAAILAGFSDAVDACYAEFSRGDYLLAVFILTAAHEKRQEVEADAGKRDYGFRIGVADPMFDRIGLERFGLGPYRDDVRAFETARALQLDGHDVAVWRSKMTSSYDRNWVEVCPGAEQHIFDAVGLAAPARAAYAAGAASRSAFLRIASTAPTPSITEVAADLEQGRWIDELPSPQNETLGFDADLWS